MTFSPASNARDRDATRKFIRERTSAELVQIIAAPNVLIGWLPGFTHDRLRTSDQEVAVSLAKAENSRRENLPGKKTPVFVASLAVAVGAVAALLSQVSAGDIFDRIGALTRAWLG
jgi:hypothetical protein